MREGSDAVTLARFPLGAATTDTFRSILYFHPELQDQRGNFKPVGGGRAIEKYLEGEGTGRLIQSLKSYVADEGFQSTSVFHRTFTIVDLLAFLLGEIRTRAEESLGPLGSRIVVGRPVVFAHASDDDHEKLALTRLRKALANVGFTDVEFEYEPVAAAYYYESTLDHDELVLIADFGGGTSDFSLVEVGPSRRKSDVRKILGTDGVAIAGDALDARIMHHVVAPRLGLGTSYKSMFGRELPVPVWIYGKLRRWHHLSFLKSKKTMELLQEIEDQSKDAGPIRALIHVLEADLGYHLYRAVERAKIDLSASGKARFAFHDEPYVAIEADVTRDDFDQWISEDTAQMADCVDRLLARVNVSAKDVDQVFMTGGTSFVPAVRKIFDDRFGHARIRAGGEMISVATGLALRAQR